MGILFCVAPFCYPIYVNRRRESRPNSFFKSLCLSFSGFLLLCVSLFFYFWPIHLTGRITQQPSTELKGSLLVSKLKGELVLVLFIFCQTKKAAVEHVQAVLSNGTVHARRSTSRNSAANQTSINHLPVIFPTSSFTFLSTSSLVSDSRSVPSLRRRRWRQSDSHHRLYTIPD